MKQASKQIFGLLRIDGLVIADSLESAFSFMQRARGLLGRSLSAGGGLWLKPGGTIHTFGMRSPIDVVFLDDQLSVLALTCRVKPWRVRRAPFGTRSTIELPAGRIDMLSLKAGDELFIEPGGFSYVEK